MDLKTQEKLKSIEKDLLENNLLSEFLEMIGKLKVFYNCSTSTGFPIGPNGPNNQGNLFFRNKTFPEKFGWMQGESHPFPHSSFITHGKFLIEVWKVTKDGIPIEESKKSYYAGADNERRYAHVYIAADVWHKFTAMEDNSVLTCIHPMRDSVTGEFVEQYDSDIFPYSQRSEPWNLTANKGTDY